MVVKNRLAVAVALALMCAACGDGGTESASSSTSSGVVISLNLPDEAVEIETTSTFASVDVMPALGVTVDAADSFDEDHLINGPGSSFVVMDDPAMIPAAEVTWLDDDSIVMGLAHSSGESHAYPVGQMAYHHIANTTIAGEPFLVTY